MQNLKKHTEKIKDIMSWTHLTEDKKMELIERVLSDAYNLGHCDGYAEGLQEQDAFSDGYNLGHCDGYVEGLQDGEMLK